MRSRIFAPAILATVPLILAAAACKSTQPTGDTAATATLSFEARGRVDTLDCWEVWYDTTDPPDGTPDTDAGFKFCQTVQKDIRLIPWHYSLEISILRAGATSPELVASSVIPFDSIPDFVSMTDYDHAVGVGATHLPDLTQTPPQYFKRSSNLADGDSAQQVGSGSPVYISTFGIDIVPPNVLQQTPSYSLTLNRGDTIIVAARKEKIADGGGPWLPTDQPPDINLHAILVVAGEQVQVTGTSTSPDDDGTGVSFSFTRR